MNAALEFVREVVVNIAELPDAFVAWSTSMSDQTFLQVMVAGLLLLTAVIARSLR